MTTIYTEEIAQAICERIANGEFLRVICREEGMPNWRTVYLWIETKPEFAKRMETARQIGADAIAEDSLIELDKEPERTETQFGDKVDAGHVQIMKVRADHRLKMLAKWHPKKYGDKLAIGGADDLPPLKTMTDEALDERIKKLSEAVGGQSK